MPSQASTKLGNVMIMQNSCAGTHLLHVLKRLSIFLCYLVILSNIQRMKHPTCLSWIFTANIVQQISATFQIYSGIYFQKYSLNQTSHHQHFQHSSIPYTEVITWLIYGSPLLVQIQFMADKLLLLSRWSNLVCVLARKQTAILCVVICTNVWIVQILNLISLNSNEKSQVFVLMNSQLLKPY